MCQQLLVYLKSCNLKAVVISVSGGVDSAAVLSLLVKAQEAAPPDHPFHPANGGKIVAVTQPIHSTPSIQNRAYEVAEAFNFV
jgi:NH3-dependent NAD+ synthetase